MERSMSEKIFERRFVAPAASEIMVPDVVDSTELPTIRGYGAVFDAVSEDLGYFKEVYRRGCFTRTLSTNPDVRALVEHDSAKVLGRTKSGTLTLREDERGLYVEIKPANTQTGSDLVTSIKRGDIDSMSLGFYVQEDKWSTRDGMPFRELLDVELVEASIVTWPAYPSTSADIRSAKLKAVLDEHLRQVEACDQDHQPKLAYLKLKTRHLELS
jgi:HK97 family phage prohead protease